ncbi:MAG: RNA polymerase subunit sigma-70, partial [Phycisphaerae bacterium]|nr:RNA polymerase subunit sigma-70 [Phycisphaerae bacterium]
MPDLVDASIKKLVAKGKGRGYLTYEEMNNDLPDEAVSPDKLDALLMTLDELGIELIDEAEAKQREGFVQIADRTEQESSARVKPKARADELEPETKRIDDPVRMYLTQMGEIPLLTRKQEIDLAKKIEMTRMHFRRRVLESDYCTQQATDILKQVHEGDLPFDRTMRISTAEDLSKETITSRMAYNLPTLEKLIARNIADWAAVRSPKTSDAPRRAILHRLMHRRRRAVRLVEDLSLRTSRIQPLMKKLQHISEKMDELGRTIASEDGDMPEEDLDVMKEELDGLKDLAFEEPDLLRKRVKAIHKVFYDYEHAKRELSGG